MESNELMTSLCNEQGIDFYVEDGLIIARDRDEFYPFVRLSKEQALVLADGIKEMADSL